MNKKISLFVLMILALSLFGSSPAPVNAVTWWDNDWSYKMKITINATKVDADLTDFPVLVYLNSSRIDWTHVQDDLDDLRFINEDDITQLYVELENYTVNSKAWVWVKIPSVDDAVDTDFYLYYGNNAVSSWWNPEDVWENSAVMVQHMTDNPDNAHVMDSTQYNNDGSKKGANEPIETASGKIDSAQDFDGFNDYILTGVNGFSGSKGTLSIIIQPHFAWNTSNQYRVITIIDALNLRVIDIYYEPVGHQWGFYESGTNNNALSSIQSFAPDTWIQLTITWDNTVEKKIYVDGYLEGTQSASWASLTPDLTYIGIFGPYLVHPFDGVLDEVCIYNEAKSAEWILADYNSGADTLLIYNAEELCPLALIVRYNTGINKLYINGTQTANNTTIYVDKDTKVNATTTLKSDFIFMKYMLGSTGASLTPTYLFNMTQPFTLWSYATPNFFIYEEPTTFTFTHWLILLFVALVISLLAAIKFHIIATVSFILVIYMIINVASFTGIILLAIIVWLLTIMFSIIAFAEI